MVDDFFFGSKDKLIVIHAISLKISSHFGFWVIVEILNECISPCTFGITEWNWSILVYRFIKLWDILICFEGKVCKQIGCDGFLGTLDLGKYRFLAFCFEFIIHLFRIFIRIIISKVNNLCYLMFWIFENYSLGS